MKKVQESKFPSVEFMSQMPQELWDAVVEEHATKLRVCTEVRHCGHGIRWRYRTGFNQTWSIYRVYPRTDYMDEDDSLRRAKDGLRVHRAKFPNLIAEIFELLPGKVVL